MMHQAILSSLPCEIVTARDGAEAVERARSAPPDLVLMDVEMPRMGGFEACRKMRELLGRRVPIILVTTRGAALFVREGFESGCSGYMTKPVAGPELLRKVRNFLGE